MINEFRSEIKWNRDRVQFCSDGSYLLLEARKLRRQKVPVPSWMTIKLENAKATATAETDDMRVVDVE